MLKKGNMGRVTIEQVIVLLKKGLINGKRSPKS